MKNIPEDVYLSKYPNIRVFCQKYVRVSKKLDTMIFKAENLKSH
jgi:hypothetical protein